MAKQKKHHCPYCNEPIYRNERVLWYDPRKADPTRRIGLPNRWPSAILLRYIVWHAACEKRRADIDRINSTLPWLKSRSGTTYRRAYRLNRKDPYSALRWAWYAHDDPRPAPKRRASKHQRIQPRWRMQRLHYW